MLFKLILNNNKHLQVFILIPIFVETLKTKIMKELIKNGCIDLGTANGWNSETFKIYNELLDMKIQGSYQEVELSNCYYKKSFDVVIENQIVKVTYKVDSGD
jgi:hypothetical protein